MIVGRVAALALASASLIGGLTACSSSPDPSPSATSAAPTAVAPTSPSAQPPQTAALQRWYVRARPALDRVDGAIVSAQKAVKHNDAASLHTACLSMQRSVGRFTSGVSPAPDRKVRVSLRRAMVDFSGAADACVSGNLATAGTSVLRGQAAVTAAAHRIDILS